MLFFGEGIDTSDKLIFYWGDQNEGNKNGYPYKIILFDEPIKKSFNLDPNADIKQIFYHPFYFLNSLTVPLSIISNQNRDLLEIEASRENLYKKFNAKNFSITSLFETYKLVQKTLRTIERSNIEFAQSKEWIKKELTEKNGIGLKKLQKINSEKESENFSDIMINQIEFMFSKLLEQISFLDKYFTRFTDLSNIQVAYNFQILSSLLGIGGFIIALISIIGNPSELIRMLCILHDLIFSIFGIK